MAKDLKNKPKPISKPPLVSVVMSVFNGEKYLREAIDSILNQTFTDFEFIIINDGSTDDTLKIIKSYKDPRIVLISRKNKGLVASLNEGIEKAKGKYIARMDADDISHRERIQKQVEELLNSPSVVVCGTFAAMMNITGSKTDKLVFPYLYPDVQRRLVIDNTIVHGSVLMRKNIAVLKYSNQVGPAEDYDLWLRCIKSKMVIIPEFLYHYRENPEGISRQKELAQIESTTQLKSNLEPIHKIPFLRPLSFARHLRQYAQTNGLARIYIYDQMHIAHGLWQKKSYLLWFINLTYYYAGKITLKLGYI